MNDPASVLSGMMSFDSLSMYEQPKPRFIFKMPRVVPDQKSKFESNELFRRLSRESEVSLLSNLGLNNTGCGKSQLTKDYDLYYVFKLYTNFININVSCTYLYCIIVT